MPSDTKPDGELLTNHVSGAMPTNERNKNLQALGNITDDQRYILSNARCLSEGVDVPALDGVAFIDPRNSEIDIVQAVGRAIRLSKGKAIGSIVIPVFIEDHEDPDEVLNSSPFKKVWAVVNALRSHDEGLGEQLDQLRQSMGKRGTVGTSDKIIFDLPTTITHEFETALKTKIVESTTASWEFWFGLLENYKEENGDCLVPMEYQVKSKLNLGWWVGTQRKEKDTMPSSRFSKLNQIGFVWDANSHIWRQNFLELQIYHKRFGNCLVPRNYITESECRLGQWVASQRPKKKIISLERQNKLNNLGFVWNILDQNWEEGLMELTLYKNEYGNCLVPHDFVATSGYELGIWVSNQRYREGKFPDQDKRLDELGFVWNTKDYAWEANYQELIKYKDEQGDCLVPNNFVTTSGIKLGSWTVNQRKKWAKNKIDAKHIDYLESLGFVWNINESAWNAGFRELLNYKTLHGDCLVPHTFITSSQFKLGVWVTSQRSKEKSLSLERKTKLNNLGFVWNTLVQKWEKGFQRLCEFKAEFGHCRVHKNQTYGDDNFKLGAWVTSQRRSDNTPQDMLDRLNTIGFIWNPLTDQWEEGFKELVIYYEENGHCLVPTNLITATQFNLGQWVGVNRRSKNNMSTKRIEMLDKLDFVWNPIAEQWETGFQELLKYRNEHGHCSVSGKYKASSGFLLGNWVSAQRLKEGGKLSVDQRTRLNDIKFVWSALENKFNLKFEELLLFKKKHGHCYVPRNHITTTGFKLGEWVRYLRRKDNLDFEKRKRLEGIEFYKLMNEN
ncbi:Helicase associated domain protein [Porticoccaceae bacterium]|nr:Helicase associated domain protein [Porticoccaceae bacterium]